MYFEKQFPSLCRLKARLHYAYFKRLSLKAQTFGRQSSFLYYHYRSNRLACLLQEIIKRKKMELLKRLKSSYCRPGLNIAKRIHMNSKKSEACNVNSNGTNNFDVNCYVHENLFGQLKFWLIDVTYWYVIKFTGTSAKHKNNSSLLVYFTWIVIICNISIFHISE